MPYKDPERQREADRRRAATPERKAYVRDMMRRRRAEGPGKEEAHAYYMKNRDRLLEDHARFRKAHPGYSTKYQKRYREKNADSLARARVRRIQAAGTSCACCGIGEWWNLTLDHIIPRSRGGGDDPANIQVLCMGCNRSKNRYTRCTLDHALGWEW